ncbi:MAG: amino acid permease [Bacteroidota bacterium]|nr:amino acid permease [Bacteroidota bacterium]
MSAFKKEITLFDATMLVAGTMIGSGIFVVSADIARTVGSSGWLMLCWVLTGVITMAGALCYGELASMFPKAGGQYVYLKESLGKPIAFLYGWTLFSVIQTGTIAAVGVIFARYTAVIFPWFSEKHILFEVMGLAISAAQILSIGIIVLLTFLNSQGVRNGKWIQNIFGVTKIGALVLLIILGILLAANWETLSHNFQNAWDAKSYKVIDGKEIITNPSGLALLFVIGSAMVGSLFSSDAWNNVTFAGDEIVNPQRNIPKALLLGTGMVTLVYILTNMMYLSVLPIHGIPTAAASAAEHGIAYATDDRVAMGVSEMMPGGFWAIAIAILIMVSTFGCVNGCILSGSRVYYSMAADGLFFGFLNKLNSKSVPARALWMQAIWASALCLSGNYGNLLDYIMFAVILFYILTIIGLFVLRVKRPEINRPYKVVLYPFLPILYILLAGTFLVCLLVAKPEYALIGLYIVLAGIPVYFLFNYFSKKTQ